MVNIQNCIWIQTASLSERLQRNLQKILKQYLKLMKQFETIFKLWVVRSLGKRKSKKVIGVTKDELGGKSMKEIVQLRAKIVT